MDVEGRLDPRFLARDLPGTFVVPSLETDVWVAVEDVVGASVAGKSEQRSWQGHPHMPLFVESQTEHDAQVLASLQYWPSAQWASHWHSSAVLRHFAGQLPASKGSPHCQQPSHS